MEKVKYHELLADERPAVMDILSVNNDARYAETCVSFFATRRYESQEERQRPPLPTQLRLCINLFPGIEPGDRYEGIVRTKMGAGTVLEFAEQDGSVKLYRLDDCPRMGIVKTVADFPKKSASFSDLREAMPKFLDRI